MYKYCFIVLSFLFLSVSPLSAAVYKGQKIFVKKCVSCHSNGQVFITTKSQDEWEDIMKNNGLVLKQLHLKNDKTKDSWNYFKSKRYTKKVKHLKDFLIEYASDSGNVPACN
jgi:cytochrome c1